VLGSAGVWPRFWARYPDREVRRGRYDVGAGFAAGMNVELFPALGAGLLGGLAMIAVRRAARAAGVGLRMDVIRLWGAFVGARGPEDRAFGWAVHLLASAVVGVLYALGFYVLGASDRLWLWGLIGALIHSAVAGVVVGFCPPMYREETSPRPGPFARNFGATDVVGFVAGHLVYGLAVGIAYGLLHPGGGPDLAF
jgi:hypothetical protein